MQADQPTDAGGRIGFPLGCVEHAVEDVEPRLEAGDRQFFLAREVVGDAGRPQADPFGNVRKVHAVEALAVEDGDCGRDYVRATALEPGARRRSRCLILSFPCHDTYASRATRKRLSSHNREFRAAAIIRKPCFSS